MTSPSYFLLGSNSSNSIANQIGSKRILFLFHPTITSRFVIVMGKA
jgi:hypothetical protein